MRAFILYPDNKDFIRGKSTYSPQAPYIVEFVMSFRFVAIFIGMIVVFFLLTNIFGVHIYEHFEIESNGVTTQGTVRSISRSIGFRFRTQSPWLCYDFYVNNSHYDDCTIVKSNTATLYPIGTVIDILYVPNNPNISRFIEGESQALASVLLMGIFIFSFFVFSLGIIYTFSFMKRTHRFNKKGVLVKGRLDKFDCQKIFDAYVVFMTVTFRLPNTTTLVSGKKKYNFKYLVEKPLSPSETFVYILYVDKKMWEVL